MHLDSSCLEAVLGLKLISQKIYFINIKTFSKNLTLYIEKIFCNATKRLCRGSESYSSTYAAPCMLVDNIVAILSKLTKL